MSVGYLPDGITKEILFERAQERFQDWVKMYSDSKVTAEYMYEDMSASCYCGAPEDDFPDAFKPVRVPVKISDTEFQYRDCTFRITRDSTDDKSYIWCGTYEEYDTLVYWIWGAVFAGDTWLISTDVLDKFIDSHEKEE